VITVPAVNEYTALFAAQRLVTEANGRFRYDSKIQSFADSFKPRKD
jgi:hypothetical protein